MAAPIREIFRVAVERILNSWTVLKLAVAHGFGGVDSQAKAEWLVFAIDQWFSENASIETYELEDFLENILNSEFDTIADDGSLQQVSRLICGCFKLCEDGNLTELQERLDKLPQAPVQQCHRQQANNDDDEDDGGGGDEEENSKSHQGPPTLTDPTQSTSHHQDSENMEVEEADEGWTFVGKKGKKR